MFDTLFPPRKPPFFTVVEEAAASGWLELKRVEKAAIARLDTSDVGENCLLRSMEVAILPI